MNIELEGLTLHVSDLAKSLDFYTRIPGGRLVFEVPGRVAILEFGRARLNLLHLNASGFHLEFTAPDIDAAYEHLKAAGLEPQSPPVKRAWGETDFRMLDPDGNIVEIAQAAPGPQTILEKR